MLIYIKLGRFSRDTDAWVLSLERCTVISLIQKIWTEKGGIRIEFIHFVKFFIIVWKNRLVYLWMAAKRRPARNVGWGIADSGRRIGRSVCPAVDENYRREHDARLFMYSSIIAGDPVPPIEIVLPWENALVNNTACGILTPPFYMYSRSSILNLSWWF